MQSTTALEPLLAKSSEILHDLDQALATLAPEGLTLTWLNPAFANLHGYRVEELMGRSSLELVIPEDTHLWLEYWQQTRVQGRGCWKSRHQHANGRLLNLKVTLKTIYDPHGQIKYFLMDVSEWRKTPAPWEQEPKMQHGLNHDQWWESLTVSETRYYSLFEQAAVGVVLCDRTGNWNHFNQKFCEILGYTQVELAQKTWEQICHPDDLGTMKSLIQQILDPDQERKAFSIEQRYYHKNRSLVWLKLGVSLVQEPACITLFDRPPPEPYFLQIVQDLTPYKRAELALEIVYERYRNIVEEQTELICRCFPDGTLTFVNPAFCRYFGFKEIELIGRNFLELLSESAHQQMSDRFQQWHHLTPNYPISQREHLVTKVNGEITWQLWTDRAIFNAAGQVIQILGVGRDITEQKIAQEAHQTSEKRYLTIIQDQTELICRYLVNGTITFVNEAYCKYFQKRREELIGHNWIPYIHPEDIAELSLQYRVLTPDNPVFTCQPRVILPDGDLRYHDWIARGIFDQVGKLVEIQAVGRDITESKRDKEALQKAQERLHYLLASSPVAIYTFHPSQPLVTTFISENCVEILGYEAEIFLKGENKWFDYLHPDDRSHILKVRQHLKQQEHETLEYRFRHPDGTYCWIQDELKLIRDAQGYPLEWIGSLLDITERKEAELALRQSQERFKHLVSASPTGIYSSEVTGDYAVTFISDNVKQISGYQPEEFYQNHRLALDCVHPEDLEQLKAARRSLLKRGYATAEYRFLRKDKVERWVQNEMKLIRNQAGKPIEILGTYLDVSDRKEVEAEMQRALDKEKELNELKSRFIAMASHEFRTPLTTILSSTQLLQRYEWQPAEKAEFFKHIHTAVKHITALLEDVLVIGRAEAGKLIFKPSPLELCGFCSRIVLEMERHLDSQRRLNLAIEFENPEMEDTPFLWVEMDEKLLRQILTNLLSNALKYSPESAPVNFTLTCSQSRIIFQVEDFGIGIPAEDLPHLFESFHRASNVGTIAGTGLGLSIVKKCVESHQGEITVESKEEKGTKITVILPKSPFGDAANQ